MSNKRWSILLPALAVSAWLAFSTEQPAEVANASLSSQQTRDNGDRPPPGTRASRDRSQQPLAEGLEQLVPRAELLPQGKSAVRRNLFAATFWLPPAAPQAAQPIDTQPPSSEFTYLGKMYDGTQWRIYLARGEETLVLTEGTTIDGIYKVEQLGPPVLKLLDLQSNLVQVVDVGAAQ